MWAQLTLRGRVKTLKFSSADRSPSARTFPRNSGNFFCFRRGEGVCAMPNREVTE
jgi:hypothetical protein